MMTDGDSLHMGHEQHFNVGSINDPMGNHFLDRPWFAQELGESLLPSSNHGAKGVELGEEILSAADHAFVVKRHVVLGINGSAPFDSPFEIFQIAPMIAVIGSKRGKIDIGYEEHPIGFDEKSAVASGVTG
jgi:hypothetical protein